MRHYEINGSKERPGKAWRQNITCHVMAETAQRALQLAIERHPDLDVFSLQHRGRIDIIEDMPDDFFAYHIEGRTAGGEWRNEFTTSKIAAEEAAMENWTVRSLYVGYIVR